LTLEKPLSDIDNEEDRRVLDVNMLAIFFVEDHPGHRYVSPVVEEGLTGGYVPVILDILPLRAYWVMTVKWGCSKDESADAIARFVEVYDRPQYAGLHKSSVLESFRLAKQLRHDVFDCTYLALARQESAKSIITTDTDFQRLCKRLKLEYVNPVPDDVLKSFMAWTQKT
jgi:predicted nucleic acid-binding protein